MGVKKNQLSKRQQIRSFLILLTFLFFPITQFYFSPYLAVWGASKGIITASYFTFGFLFLSSLFFGRAMCGWIMPCAGMQETFSLINGKKPIGKKSHLIKYIIWIPWIASIVILTLLAGGYKSVDYFFHLEHGISVSNVYMFIPYYSVIIIFFVISIVFGKRANCHYVCWMSPFMVLGRKTSNFLNLPALRLAVDGSKCTDCKICVRECPMSLNVNQMVKTNKMENSECILCGNCVDLCSKKVIKYYFGRQIKENTEYNLNKELKLNIN